MKQWNKPELLSMGLENTFDLVEPLKKPDIDDGHTDATDEEIINALEEACAYDFVKKLPEGIYCSIGERGLGFSEGQNQRLSIARALLRNSPILLLDEATSALDVDTERRVLKNIMESNKKRTCIVTTHRPSVLNMCDRVYRIYQSQVNLVEQSEVEQMVVDF